MSVSSSWMVCSHVLRLRGLRPTKGCQQRAREEQTLVPLGGASHIEPRTSPGGLGLSSEHTKDGSDLQESPMSKLEKIKLDMLSIDGKFPGSTQTNTSLRRIRGTINAYVASMSKCGWWSTFKPGTVRALERRLNMHETAVKAGLDVDTMTAFEQLQRRVNALLTIHKVLSQWVRGEADGVLEQMSSHLPHVVAYMNYVEKDFGEDLQVAVAKCEFNIVFRTTGSM